MSGTLLIGATGHLGRASTPVLVDAGLAAGTHAELEVSDTGATDALLARVAPSRDGLRAYLAEPGHLLARSATTTP